MDLPDPDSKWTRRGALGLGVSALGAAVGLHYWDDKEDNRQNGQISQLQDPDGKATEQIPGYTDSGDFVEHKRVVNQKAKRLSNFRNQRKKADRTEVDELLEEGGDIRVSLEGDVSENPRQTNADLGGLVEDPEYVLSDLDQDVFKTVVQESKAGKAEQTFTRFDMDPISVEDVAETVQSEYGLVDSDMEVAKTIIEENQDINVFQATDLESEQPVADPEALAALSDKLRTSLRGMSQVYHSTKDAGAEIDQYQNSLANGIQTARNEKDSNDTIQHIDRASKLLQHTEQVNNSYQEATTGMAKDIARLATAKHVVEQAYQRAKHVDQVAAGDAGGEPQDGGEAKYRATPGEACDVTEAEVVDETGHSADELFYQTEGNDLEVYRKTGDGFENLGEFGDVC